MHGKTLGHSGFFIEHKEDEHGERGDTKLVRLRFPWGVHRYNSLTERITDNDLSTGVLVGIEPIELLEFVVNMLGHSQANVLERRPVGCLKALDTELELGGSRELILSTRCSAEVCVVLFGLFLTRQVVLEHSLHLSHLLHAARNL